MAFASKIGSLLKCSLSSKPSIYQAVRWMSSSKIFVGGLSYNTDDQTLREAFSGYGEVVEARVILDRDTGRSRGFGFITFTSGEEASSAITAMDGKTVVARGCFVHQAALLLASIFSIQNCQAYLFIVLLGGQSISSASSHLPDSSAVLLLLPQLDANPSRILLHRLLRPPLADVLFILYLSRSHQILSQLLRQFSPSLLQAIALQIANTFLLPAYSRCCGRCNSSFLLIPCREFLVTTN
ncbi:hypothetical protein KSP40_PGU019860 [Platanthera guangdongensis]|uniref:RRM domain-containing protein n=1 Tax=Platanthera guangdongensis TaxID=2320717 RepID=A0ABR2M360_9ASPA